MQSYHELENFHISVLSFLVSAIDIKIKNKMQRKYNSITIA